MSSDNKVTELKNHNALNIQDILRAQDIARWTIVNISRPQSLAEHTFNVVAIARAIATYAGVEDTNIIKYALDHDLDEIITGDIPTPAKETMKIRDQYAGKSKDACSQKEIAIVMIADLIEAVNYLNVHALGRHAVQVQDNLIDRLNSRIALYCAMDRKLQNAIGQVIADINEGKFAQV